MTSHAYQPIAARLGVELRLEVPETTPTILVDEGRMLQVLKNLVDNALRYTPQGGTIALSASGNEQVQMRVTDSGSGIDAEDLPYVFDRFYRADTGARREFREYGFRIGDLQGAGYGTRRFDPGRISRQKPRSEHGDHFSSRAR